MMLTWSESSVRFGHEMSYVIRDAVEQDLAMILTFLDKYLRRDYFITRWQLRHVLGHRYHTMVLALEGEGLVGIAIMSKASRTLLNLLVHPDERRRGIGDALLATLKVERVRAKLDVADGDPRDFYRARGFRSSGRFNDKGNIEIMVVDLDSPPEWAQFACSQIMPLFAIPSE